MAQSYLSPTYVTYVEFRQNLTGPSAILTTPKRGIASLDSPGQQRVGIWRTASPDRRHIKEGLKELGELIFEVLETLDAVQMCGIAFHNFGPWTANELSNRVWLAAELVLLLDEWLPRSLVFAVKQTDVEVIAGQPCKIFHMCREWSVLFFFARTWGQVNKLMIVMKLLHTSDLDMKVFWTLSSSWMSLIFDCTNVLNFHTVIDLSLILDTVVNKHFIKF